MKVGDLVRFKKAHWPLADAHADTIGVIVDEVVDTKTYRSAGCKKIVVLTAQGTMLRTWPGNLEVISESR